MDRASRKGLWTLCRTAHRRSAALRWGSESSFASAIDAETGLAYSTNPGNLRLVLADLLDPEKGSVSAPKVPESKDGELEIER